MSLIISWFTLACVLLVLELHTGTFYLLVFGLAATAAGVLAVPGFSLTAQLGVASLVAILGVIGLRRRGSKLPLPNASLDIGQRVDVPDWCEDNTARVNYRGTEWDARLWEGEAARPLHCVIREIQGNTLILSAILPTGVN